MSLVAMADAKVVEQVRVKAGKSTRKRRGRGGAESADTPAPVGVKPNIVNQLVMWIPTEAITLYVGYVALFDPAKPKTGTKLSENDFSARWWGFAVFCILTAAFVLGTYIGKRRETTTKVPFKLPLFEMFFGTVAFACWAAALPDTPFQDIEGYKVSYGGYAVAAAAAGITFLAWVAGKTPFYEKT